MQHAEKSYPADMLKLLLGHRWLLTLVAGVCATAVVIIAHFLPLRYTGTAVFEFGLESAAEQISRSSKDSFGTIKERLRHDLTGYNAVEKGIQNLGLVKGLPHDVEGQLTIEGRAQLQQLVEQVMRGLDVRWEARSLKEDLVSISFTWHDPWLAEKLPNELVSEYTERTCETLRNSLKRQHDFLLAKVNDCDKTLQDLTRRQIQFETEHGGMLPTDLLALQERIQQARTSIDTLRHEQQVGRRSIEQLERLRDGGTIPDTQPAQVVKQINPELLRLREQVNRLKEELDVALWRERKTEKHPLVIALRAKIAESEKLIEETPPEIVSERVFAPIDVPTDVVSAIQAAQWQVEVGGRNLARLESLMPAYESLWANFGPLRQEYLRFNANLEEHRLITQRWRERLEDAEVALAAAVNNRLTYLKTVQPAHEQLFPSWPKMTHVLGLMLAGAAGAVGIVIVALKTLDRSIMTAEDAACYFELPVHGVIAEIVPARVKTIRGLKRWTFRPLVTAVLLLVMGLSIMSIMLRLNNPRKYVEWKTAPLQYVNREFYQPAVSFLKDL
ncbi:MAG: hypothetical protein GXY38_02090 [Planctomycetes bacterium]|mgnify:CR=1 FL=1|nr:hypothetical protein [Planctomycetota bacterium]